MIQHSFKSLHPDQLEEVFSRFLISSWSYSAATQFARNELVFEMRYIYKEQFRKSASAVAGDAYHEALKYYFWKMKQGEPIPELIDLEKLAYAKITSIAANDWKIQKTTPSVLDCQESATKSVNRLLLNFVREISLYIDEIQEVLDVELYLKDFIILNGVEIPLPASGVVDLVVLLKDGRIVIIDHKSKASYSDEEEAAFIMGTQGITYFLLYGTVKSIWADEIWFIENKTSENRDKSPQMVKFPVVLSKDVIATYEYMLYEPVKRMLDAVANPDHVYIMNESDNFVSKSEQYDFMFKRMMVDLEDFDVEESKKELISLRNKKIKDSAKKMLPPKLIKEFKNKASAFIKYDFTNKNMENSEKIEHVLRRFNIPVSVKYKLDGYSSDSYLLEFEPGVKISAIHSHKLDLANALNVTNVRISKDLRVYENKAYLEVQVSNKKSDVLLWDKKELIGQKIPIGKNNFGETLYWDYDNQSTPHMLICGGTGSGKSVFVNSNIEYSIAAKVDEIIILDPKFEFIHYKSNDKVSVFNKIEDIEAEAERLVAKMDAMIEAGEKKRIIVVLDEFADAYMKAKSTKELEVREEVQDGFYAPKKMKGPFGDYMSDPMPKMKMKVVGHKKSLEENIQSLLQKGRSTGFRLMLATQRADAKTISGSAKVNLPIQVCFKVQKAVDSMVVLDEVGAESLTGNGDGLINSPEYPDLVRFQSFYKA